MYRRTGARGGARANGSGRSGPRVPIKGQRKINTPQQPRVAIKSNPPRRQDSAGVIGVSKTPLAARFAQLSNDVPAAQKMVKKPQNIVVNMQKQAKKPGKKTAASANNKQQQQQQFRAQQQKQKLAQITQANRTKRQQVMGKRRTGLEQITKPKIAAKPTQRAGVGGRGRGVAAAGGRGRGAAVAGGRGRGAAPAGGRGGRGSGRGGAAKEKSVTGEDLDTEMDAYWHEAGKGPDPQAAQLDRQMDQYWAAKPKNEDS